MKKIVFFLVLMGVFAAIGFCDEDEQISRIAGITQTTVPSAMEQQINTAKAGMTAGSLIWGLIFSSIGTGFFIFGKKKSNMLLMFVSVVLIGYPYVVQKTVPIILVGAALTAACYLVRKPR
jgi:hypothetical protein